MTRLEVLYSCVMVYSVLALIVSPFSFWIAEDLGWAGEKLVYLNKYKWHAQIWLVIKSYFIITIISLIFCIPSFLFAILILGGFVYEYLLTRKQIHNLLQKEKEGTNA